MHSCVLSPPNSRGLSDRLIGDVQQRVGRRNVTSEIAGTGWSEAEVGARTFQQQMTYLSQCDTAHEMGGRGPYATTSGRREGQSGKSPTSCSVTLLRGQTTLPSARKRTPWPASDLDAAAQVIEKIKAANPSIDAELQIAVVEEALKSKTSLRERRRVNQARYRKKLRKSEADTQTAITKLRSEIEDLESRYGNLSHFPTTSTLWAIAGDYFRNFRRYIASPDMLLNAATEFLRGAMASDVICGSRCGVDAQIENWKLFAFYFEDARVEVEKMTKPTENTVVASTITKLTLTRSTLHRVFPHLPCDVSDSTQGASKSLLAAKMLDQTIEVRGSVLFGWDSKHDNLTRLHAQTDMLSPMVKLLGHLEDVSCVFSEALISPNGNFVKRE